MDERVVFSVVLRERSRRQLEKRAEDVSMPDEKDFGSHLDWKALSELVVLDDLEIDAAQGWFRKQGMTVLTDGLQSAQHFLVEATGPQIQEAFGMGREQWNQCAADVRRNARLIPAELAGTVVRISGVLPDPVDRPSQTPHPLTSAEGDTPSTPVRPATLACSPEPRGGITPAQIRSLYQFPDPTESDGAGETIALVMFEGEFDRTSFDVFWAEHGGGRTPPDIAVVEVGPPGRPRRQDAISNLEVAQSVQWAAAMAPAAKIVIYFVDPGTFADPWAAFLMEIVADELHTPTVAAISWVNPERDYYRTFGHRVIVGALAQAACRGISIVAAAGNWGAFDGKPRYEKKGKYVVNAAWPHGVFPAVEEMVLGVGGTMVTALDPLTEIAWSGPPALHLQKLLATKSMAGSGGFSDEVPQPVWQARIRGAYSRGTGSPAVVAYGRGFPDVALMAAGPAVQPSPTRGELTSQGYQAVTGGQWVDYAGGTSIGAPIWAAILALVNQARRDANLGRVGWVNPALYRVASPDPGPFRPVLNGNADVELWAVNDVDQAVPYHLDGYRCLPSWDPVTGLGVPNVTGILDAFTRTT